MQPVLRRDVSGQSEAAHDVLGDEGHQRGVLGVMIERVTGGEPFDDEPSSFIEQGGKARFATAEMYAGRHSITAGPVHLPGALWHSASPDPFTAICDLETW